VGNPYHLVWRAHSSPLQYNAARMVIIVRGELNLDDLRKDADELDRRAGSQQMLDDIDEPTHHRSGLISSSTPVIPSWYWSSSSLVFLWLLSMEDRAALM